MHSRFRFLHSLTISAALAAASASMPALAQSEPGANYVEAVSYLDTDAEYEAWFDIQHGLRRNFDDICGDTFCEGDYSNIQSLGYNCSVDETSGRIGMCVWVFAGSIEEIDPVTGKISARQAFWRCKTQLAPGTTMDSFLAALQGSRPLYATLPGSDQSIYDGLIDCL